MAWGATERARTKENFYGVDRMLLLTAFSKLLALFLYSLLNITPLGKQYVSLFYLIIL
jgi:Co/Zn/Cd efflux system component